MLRIPFLDLTNGNVGDDHADVGAMSSDDGLRMGRSTCRHKETEAYRRNTERRCDRQRRERERIRHRSDQTARATRTALQRTL
jgi:hypothetical protein